MVSTRTATRRVGLVTAIGDAIDHEMERNDRVIYIGVDAHLGIFGYGRGLAEKYGTERVRTTPISEYGEVGIGGGAAITGMRPIVDLCIANFLYTAWCQIANQLAKMPYMTNGQIEMPVVLIAGAGSAGNAGQHSDVPTGPLMNLGGMDVVYASTPEDAGGLMTTALRSHRPCVFLYPTALSSERGETPVVGEAIPFGQARVRRSGTDITCWATGHMVKRALAAAEQLDEEGISVEVIDPRTLNPFDEETLIASVEKTGRLIAVDEAHGSASVGSEAIARVARHALDHLDCPPVLVAAPDDITVPNAAVLEAAVVPSVERIRDACRDIVGAGAGAR